jgi:hypothetical protein
MEGKARLESITEYPIKREPKTLYYIDKEGYVWKCAPRAKKPEVVA